MIRKTAQRLMVAGFALFTPLLALAQSGVFITDGEVVQLEDPYGWLPVAAMIGLVVIILAALAFASIREKRKQHLLMRFADKGQEVPRELLPPTPSPQREMRRGVWLLSLGLSLGLVLFIATSDWKVAAWCLILLFLGAASFINAALFYPKSSSD